jgi:hypothetical protein
MLNNLGVGGGLGEQLAAAGSREFSRARLADQTTLHDRFLERIASYHFRRPFDLEHVALYSPDVEVAFDGECGYPLAAALADIAKGLQRPEKIATCLFLEFSSGSGGVILTLSHLALRNRPCALTLVPPEWSAGMNQQDLKPVTGPPVHEDSSARSQEFSPLADITTKELSCAKVVPRLYGEQNCFDD